MKGLLHRLSQHGMVFVLLLLVGACFQEHFPRQPHMAYVQDPTLPTFSIATYNINWRNGEWGKHHPGATMDLIKQLNTDTILLQEVSPLWVSMIKQHMIDDYPYRVFKPRYDEGGV